jgi:transmembrane sensor
MQDIHSLIKKYWAGTATIEEQILLMELLSSDDAGLEQGMRAAYESDLSKRMDVLSGQKSEEILARIMERKETGKRKEGNQKEEIQKEADQKEGIRSKLVYWPKRWGVWAAAAVIIILAGTALITFSGHPTRHSAPVAVVAQPVREVENFSNTGKKAMVVQLKDKSVVVLLPRSSISYFQSSSEAGRNINLSGKAYFKIARDPARPFTVYANAIATTVLGTEFTVNTFMDGKVIIRLVNGKVRVHARDTSYSMSDLYLQPGQEAAIDIKNRQPLVHNFDVEAEERLGPISDRRPNRIEQRDIVFDKAPLAEVFDRLRRKYHIPIVYEKDDIKGLQFTGIFLKSDSLPMLLSVVCNMNGLAFRQDAGKILIHKVE